MSEEAQKYRITDLFGTSSDYSDKNNWAYLPENTDKEVDTFFVYPTVYMNPAPDAPEIVPIDDEMMRAGVKAHFREAPQAFVDKTNLYEPYYRQSNLCAVGNLAPYEFMDFQKKEQRTDVYAALDYYFEHYNQGRPFILASHSQGSMMLKLALREYFKEHVDYLERMVAAYVIGYAITTDDLEANPALKFAERADDTYAPASENLGDRISILGDQGIFPVDFQIKHPGLADAQVDVERGVVVCTTLSDQYVSIPEEVGPNLFGPASLHLSDYPAYWDNLCENIKTRINAYLNK